MSSALRSSRSSRIGKREAFLGCLAINLRTISFSPRPASPSGPLPSGFPPRPPSHAGVQSTAAQGEGAGAGRALSRAPAHAPAHAARHVRGGGAGARRRPLAAFRACALAPTPAGGGASRLRRAEGRTGGRRAGVGVGGTEGRSGGPRAGPPGGVEDALSQQLRHRLPS